jgi:Trypsin-like peptidase domain
MAATANFLTFTITKLELLYGANHLGNATGFFLKQGHAWFLVTNWHVLAGRDPRTGQPRHPSGAVPDACRFFIGVMQNGTIVWIPTVQPLGDASTHSAIWLQHPVGGQEFDVAALPLALADVGLGKNFLESGGHDPDMFIDLGDDLFLPGFPLGLAANGYMPIWKRASLASSLEFGDGMSRFFYVDTATREGMSGAPCLATSNWRHYALDRSTNKVRVVERPLSWRFLGVYSGRLNPSDSFEAQIGVVWRDVLVVETIAHGVPAGVNIK